MSSPTESNPAEELLPGAMSHDAQGWVTARPPRAREVFQRILSFPLTIARNRDLLGTSVKRELESRFQGTLLSWAWPLVSPVFLFVAYYFIFTKLLQVKFPDLPPGLEAAMGIFMFVGVLIWAAFAETLSRACGAIVDNGNLIKKLVFPAEILPLNLVLVNLVTMCFGMVIFLLATLLTPIWPAPDPLMLLWIPVLLLLQTLFTYGLALGLSTLNVFIRDTAQVIPILVTVWMFLSPVFWSPELLIRNDIPFEQNPILAFMGLIEGNPIYHLLFSWRTVLMHEQPSQVFADSVFQPDFMTSISTFALWALGSFLIGYTFFILAHRRFADEV